MQNHGYVQPRGAQPQAQVFAAHPLAQLAVAFALGVLSVTFFAVQLWLLLSIAALTTLICFTSLLKKRLKFATTSVILAALFAGASLASIEQKRVPANQLKRLLNEGTLRVGEPIELTGVLERDPELA